MVGLPVLLRTPAGSSTRGVVDHPIGNPEVICPRPIISSDDELMELSVARISCHFLP